MYMYMFVLLPFFKKIKIEFPLQYWTISWNEYIFSLLFCCDTNFLFHLPVFGFRWCKLFQYKLWLWFYKLLTKFDVKRKRFWYKIKPITHIIFLLFCEIQKKWNKFLRNIFFLWKERNNFSLFSKMMMMTLMMMIFSTQIRTDQEFPPYNAKWHQKKFKLPSDDDSSSSGERMKLFRLK